MKEATLRTKMIGSMSGYSLSIALLLGSAAFSLPAWPHSMYQAAILLDFHGFNLGIEAMQLTVVAVALPSLFLLSRTRLYPSVRNVGAVFAGSAAVGWIAQRLWDLPNPADALVSALAQHAAWIATGLTLLGIIAASVPALKDGGGATLMWARQAVVAEHNNP